MSNAAKKNIKVHFPNQCSKDQFLTEKKHFQNLYIDCVFYDFSFQLIYLSSSLLFSISFT